jgi:hypothetical protein
MKQKISIVVVDESSVMKIYIRKRKLIITSTPTPNTIIKGEGREHEL